MKKSIFQHIIGLFPAEMSHTIRMRMLGIAGKLPTGKWWLKRRLAPRKIDLTREVFGMRFTNPIGIGAGIDPNGDRLKEFSAMGFGFVEIGSVVPKPQQGSPHPRLRRLRKVKSYIDNSGYPSKGLDYVLDNVRNRNKHSRRLVVGCNIGKQTTTHREDIPREYLRVFRNMYQYVDFFVINIACNTSSKQFVPRSGEDIRAIVEPLFEFRRGQADYRPILVKISPDLSREEIDSVIDILIETPLDGIEAVAGSLDMVPDRDGVASGSILTERAIEVVKYIHQRTDGNYPIIGSGGMMAPEDIKRMLEAGASLVALNTGIRENGFRLLKYGSKHIATTPEENRGEVTINENDKLS